MSQLLFTEDFEPKGESSFTLISFIILQDKCDNLICIILGFGILKNINERKKS